MHVKRNRFKVILYLVVVIFFFLTFIVFSRTLALFEDNASGLADSDIGRWIIKINNTNITSGNSQTLTINNFVYQGNALTANNTIAPGTSAYFDLVVDATDCDVAVRYDINFKFDQMEYANNILFTVDGTGTIRTGENTYSGVISLSDIQNDHLVTLRVNITWDNLDQDIYNEADTILGTTLGSNLRIPIDVHAEQYLGETIVPYNPSTANIRFISRSVAGEITVGDVLSLGDFGNYYVFSTNNTTTKLIPYYNSNVGPNKSVSIDDYVQDSSITNGVGALEYSGSDYWTGHIGTTYSGSNNGNPYPYVFDSHSNLYEYCNDFKDMLNDLNIPVINVKLLSYEEAETIRNLNESLLCNSTFWLGSSRWGSIYIVEKTASTCETKAVGYNSASGRGFRPVVLLSTDDLS